MLVHPDMPCMQLMETRVSQCVDNNCRRPLGGSYSFYLKTGTPYYNGWTVIRQGYPPKAAEKGLTYGCPGAIIGTSKDDMGYAADASASPETAATG